MEQHSNALKVMVIDDSKTIRRTAETLLKNMGVRGHHGDRRFRRPGPYCRSSPAHYLCRHHDAAPGCYQTCALVKNNPAFKSIPVIMLSSKDGLFDKAKGRIVGVDQFLTKPFSKEELLGRSRPMCLGSPQ